MTDETWPPPAADLTPQRILERYRYSAAQHPGHPGFAATLAGLEEIVARGGPEDAQLEAMIAVFGRTVDAHFAEHPEDLERANRIATQGAFGMATGGPPPDES